MSQLGAGPAEPAGPTEELGQLDQLAGPADGRQLLLAQLAADASSRQLGDASWAQLWAQQLSRAS